MDMFTAMRYVVTAADTHSFTSAADRLNVTTAAIAKQVTVLEETLSTTLFARSAKGLTLTAHGERYVEGAREVLAAVDQINLSVSPDAEKARGTLILATQPEVAMLPWLTDFHNTYPDVQLELRNLTRNAISATPADVYMLHGWPDEQNLIQANVAQTRFVTCAAPSYWKSVGMPRHPNELSNHTCLLYAVDGLTVNDLWCYTKGQEHVKFVARGWLQSNNRPTTIAAACRGAGVLRVPDLLVAEQLLSGQLMPTLNDWVMDDPPPIVVLYGQEHRRTPRLKLFLDFMSKFFAAVQTQISPNSPLRTVVPRPWWSKRGYARASDVPDVGGEGERQNGAAVQTPA